MNIAIITGSSGLVGGESVEFFAGKFDKVIGIDNNMRSYFFGETGSSEWNKRRLIERHSNFESLSFDVRDKEKIEDVFRKYSNDIKLIIHAAAQPSHDWAANEPLTDFSINANGTLNMLELYRNYSPDAVFIFTSTNKVYGDSPNALPLDELDKRWEISPAHRYFANGIDESMTIDRSLHSVFGAGKLAADILTQEYGRYFGLKTGVFRGGCLTGPYHSGAQLHGFLSYLMKCAISKKPYTVFGYKGKQVRDNIHSYDLVNMFWHFYNNPRPGEVYNAGGGRFSNCSMLEAIEWCEKISGNKIEVSYNDVNRVGDHIWYVSDVSHFRNHFPHWNYKYNLEDTLVEMYNNMLERHIS